MCWIFKAALKVRKFQKGWKNVRRFIPKARSFWGIHDGKISSFKIMDNSNVLFYHLMSCWVDQWYLISYNLKNEARPSLTQSMTRINDIQPCKKCTFHFWIHCGYQNVTVTSLSQCWVFWYKFFSHKSAKIVLFLPMILLEVTLINFSTVRCVMNLTIMYAKSTFFVSYSPLNIHSFIYCSFMYKLRFS